MSSISFVLYIGLCILPFTIADCVQPSLPFIAPCSGNGQCFSDSCRCNEGYSGVSIFYNALGHDCNTHDLSFNILSYISFGTCILAVLSGIYRLITFAPLKKVSWTVSRDSLIIICCIVTSTSLGVVWQGLYLFGGYYVHNSIVSCILFMAMWIILQFTLFIITRSYINLAWTTVLQKNLQMSYLIVLATPLAVNGLGAGCILGIYLSPNHEIQIAFAQSFGGVFGPCLLFLALSLVVIVSMILKSINRHLKASEMTKHTKNYEIIHRGIAKLQQSRLIMLISLVVPSAATVAWVMMPLLITYLLPVFFAITALCDILYVLRILTPSGSDVIEGRSTGLSQSKSGILSSER